jgi:hypothetical protein
MTKVNDTPWSKLSKLMLRTVEKIGRLTGKEIDWSLQYVIYQELLKLLNDYEETKNE